MKLELISRAFMPSSVAGAIDIPSKKNPVRKNKSDIVASLAFLRGENLIGLELFLAKIKINKPDKSFDFLYQIAIENCESVPSLKKLSPSQRKSVLEIICASAFEDFARSAATTRPCKNCSSMGFLEAEVFTNCFSKNKACSPVLVEENAKSTTEIKGKWRQIREVVRVLCHDCKGKGYVSSACQCRGRGKVINREKTELVGLPVMKNCSKCHGKGYTRLPFSSVLGRLKPLWPVGKSKAYKEVKPFFNMLVARCHQEEAKVETELKKINYDEF
ncbi:MULTISPECIES: antitermination protein [Erwinia]|uniref:antitermination protein Q n=1 Tax=Erwinia TaxID=551 RepID=UPI0010606DE0|nr:antitermination protein [Erwinia aphidicola]MCP2234057.1 hypothetical protein [Erwinia aphidicola]